MMKPLRSTHNRKPLLPPRPEVQGVERACQNHSKSCGHCAWLPGRSYGCRERRAAIDKKYAGSKGDRNKSSPLLFSCPSVSFQLILLSNLTKGGHGNPGIEVCGSQTFRQQRKSGEDEGAIGEFSMCPHHQICWLFLEIYSESNHYMLSPSLLSWSKSLFLTQTIALSSHVYLVTSFYFLQHNHFLKYVVYLLLVCLSLLECKFHEITNFIFCACVCVGEWDLNSRPHTYKVHFVLFVLEMEGLMNYLPGLPSNLKSS